MTQTAEQPAKKTRKKKAQAAEVPGAVPNLEPPPGFQPNALVRFPAAD